jgi:hypothetical protein
MKVAPSDLYTMLCVEMTDYMLAATCIQESNLQNISTKMFAKTFFFTQTKTCFMKKTYYNIH